MNFLREEGEEGEDDVVVSDVGMFLFWFSLAVHDDECGVVRGCYFGIGGLREAADVVEHVSGDGECGIGDLWAPGVDGEEWWEELGGVAWGGQGNSFMEFREEGCEAINFFGGCDGLAVGAGAFCADVYDIGSEVDELAGVVECPCGVEAAVGAEGVVVDIDDAHDEWAAWKVDLTFFGKEEEIWLGKERMH